MVAVKCVEYIVSLLLRNRHSSSVLSRSGDFEEEEHKLFSIDRERSNLANDDTRRSSAEDNLAFSGVVYCSPTRS